MISPSDGDAIGRKVVELQSQRLEKKIQLEDLLQDLDLQAPSGSAKDTKKAPRKAEPAATKAPDGGR